MPPSTRKPSTASGASKSRSNKKSPAPASKSMKKVVRGATPPVLKHASSTSKSAMKKTSTAAASKAKSGSSRSRGKNPIDTSKSTSRGRSRAVSTSKNRSGNKTSRLVSPSAATTTRVALSPNTKQRLTNSKNRKTILKFYLFGFSFIATAGFLFSYVLPPLSSVKACDELVNKIGFQNFWFHPEKELVAFNCLSKYKEEHEFYLYIGFCFLYLSMQSFVIPGTLLLSILSGALFPFFVAEFLVAVCATTGATISFLISKVIGQAFLDYFKLDLDLITEKLHSLMGEEGGGDASSTGGHSKNAGSKSSGKGGKKNLSQEHKSLVIPLTLLRVTPFPNLLLNIGAPHVGIHAFEFYFSTLLGLVPLNTVHILSGRALAEFGKVEKGPVLSIMGVGTVLLVAVLLWKRRKVKSE
ncbi:unnamed protein product [Amoebophrya sp. A120]|nr:unnamed protein product [Amoebophrya sp. A120]|eukprot:GSA120T00013634001.1